MAARPSAPRAITDPVASHVGNVNETDVLEAARAKANNPMVILRVVQQRPMLEPGTSRTRASCMPMSPYAASKLAGEIYVSAYQQSFGIPALAVRFCRAPPAADSTLRQRHAAAISPTWVGLRRCWRMQLFTASPRGCR